ncbi:hypothetical protein BH23VER1_BH23VER1_08070 [soil metagenome]
MDLSQGLRTSLAALLFAAPFAAIADERTSAASVAVTSTVPLPRVYTPVRSRAVAPKYPWREQIVTTIFWIGERPTANNPTPNHMSSWDTRWAVNYGGYDDPNPEARTHDFCPIGFTPGQNPFYVALPYNDVIGSKKFKPEARRVIPWFKDKFTREGKTVCKGQWVAIRFGKKICYAQWEDCGPWTTDDWRYVFGGEPPQNTTKNNGAALDVSPAVRDYLGIRSGARCDWRFATLEEVTAGPWRIYGENNHFVQAKDQPSEQAASRMAELKRPREAWLKQQRYP